MGDAAAIRRAGAIVAAAAERRPAVVVSAAGGLTDQLLLLMEAAADGGGEGPLGEISVRHQELIAGLGLPQGLLDGPLAELRKLVRGIELLREVTPRTRDKLLSYGERLMAPLFAAHLCTLGLEARPWVAGALAARKSLQCLL